MYPKANLPKRQWTDVADGGCELATDGEGRLRIRPRDPVVSVDSVRDMLAALSDRAEMRLARELTFDFSGTARIAPHWTVVLASLIAFARRTPIACRLVAGDGQAGEALRFYLRQEAQAGTCVNLN